MQIFALDTLYFFMNEIRFWFYYSWLFVTVAYFKWINNVAVVEHLELGKTFWNI